MLYFTIRNILYPVAIKKKKKRSVLSPYCQEQ